MPGPMVFVGLDASAGRIAAIGRASLTCGPLKLTRRDGGAYNSRVEHMAGVTSVKDLLCDEFQETVNSSLVRHKSILDVLTKLQESTARVGRAIAKAVTACGCVQIAAEKQHIPEDISLTELAGHMDKHFNGELCEHCRDILESEIGSTLFYLTAVIDTLDLNLYDCLIKEHQRVSALGRFNVS